MPSEVKNTRNLYILSYDVHMLCHVMLNKSVIVNDEIRRTSVLSHDFFFFFAENL